MGLEYRGAGSTEEILDAVVAATGDHPAWYFNECLMSVKMFRRAL
jgi:hypothetical protein